MRLWAFIATGGEEETRRVRCGATVATVDDSGYDCEEEAEEAVVVTKEGLTATEKEATVATTYVGEMGKTAAEPTVAVVANCEELSNSSVARGAVVAEGGKVPGSRGDWRRGQWLWLARAVVVIFLEEETRAVVIAVGGRGWEQKAGAVGKQQNDLVRAAREGREMAGMTGDGCGCGDEVGKRWREKKRQHWIRQLAATVVEI
ncbi:hypothetical protein B296_00032600 [Ensete ventricosum]|uniref:Uncharacterized protein n=1 Tax=Ensete ventricosum TaxID=4639 RepID=A0A426ZY22_ENSVE|nr:hypothetical protein B296_00032600 [Ensete ventricosum]